MAYYDPLIAKWATAPAGTTDQKLTWINAQTVTGPAIPMKVAYTELFNRLDRTQFGALVAADQASIQRMLAQQTVDFSPGSEARRFFLQKFPSGTSYTNLQTYITTFDAPKIPWPTAPVTSSGGGLSGMVSMNDLTAAGII